MHRIGVAVLALSLGCGFVLFGQLKSAGESVPIPRVTIVPLTISWHELLNRPDQTRPVESTVTTLAIRSDGSTASSKVVSRLDGKSVLYRTRELFFSNGDRAQIDDISQVITAVKTRLAFSPELPLLKREADCSIDEMGAPVSGTNVGTTTILGYRAVGFRRDQPALRSTTWRAPDLGCIDLRRLAEFKDKNGNVTDTSDLVATRIVVGEPDSSYFVVPVHYEAVSFSGRVLREAGRTGKLPGPDALARFHNQDEFYKTHRISDLDSLGKTPRVYTE